MADPVLVIFIAVQTVVLIGWLVLHATRPN